MSQVTVEKTINAPKDEVWNVMADFAGIYVYGPSITKSYTINDQTTGLGAERRCEFDPNGEKYVNERIIEWVPGESYVVNIYSGTFTPPVDDIRAVLAVHAISPNQTRVTIDFDYIPKYGPVGMVMNAVMIKRFMRKAATGIVDGLKHYIETGEEVESFTTLKLATPA